MIRGILSTRDVTDSFTQSYLDPRNPRHALLEAESLVQLADGNEDGKLSKAEMLAAADLFLASKVIDIETYFHDEF